MLWKVLTITFLVLTIHFGFHLFTRPSSKKQPVSAIDPSDNRTQLIIDTDAGGDDAVAILLALAAQDRVQVIGITCVYGNTNETNVETNVLKILTVANRTDIPVYSGSRKPLLRPYVAGDYFGKDGLGDFDFGRPVKGAINRSAHAAVAMLELTRRHPGAISILTLGPLTNVALAASLDANFTRNVQRFYVMGAMVNETRPGEEAEFNFSLDPESDAMFLKSPTRLKSFVAPYDVVEKRSIPMKWRTSILGSSNSAVMQFLNKVEATSMSQHTAWRSADTVAVATMIWPEIVTLSLEADMSVVTCDEARQGAVLVDYRSAARNVELVRDFNVTGFQEILLRHLAGRLWDGLSEWRYADSDDASRTRAALFS